MCVCHCHIDSSTTKPDSESPRNYFKMWCSSASFTFQKGTRRTGDRKLVCKYWSFTLSPNFAFQLIIYSHQMGNGMKVSNMVLWGTFIFRHNMSTQSTGLNVINKEAWNMLSISLFTVSVSQDG